MGKPDKFICMKCYKKLPIGELATPPVGERLDAIDETFKEWDERGQDFALRLDSLEAQVKELKRGEKLHEDWKCNVVVDVVETKHFLGGD